MVRHALYLQQDVGYVKSALRLNVGISRMRTVEESLAYFGVPLICASRAATAARRLSGMTFA